MIENMLCHLNAFGGHFSWKEIPNLASAIAYLERLNIFIDATDVLFNEKMSGGSFDDLCHVGFTRLL